MDASKSDKDLYNTSMLHTYQKEKYKTKYEVNYQLCIHSIKEMLFIRKNNGFLSVLESNLLLEFLLFLK